MKVLVFDFEVFKYDVLLGVYNVNTHEYYQTWNLSQIKDFYYSNKDAIWVGHNNTDYDNHILESIIKNKNPYEVSQEIIQNHKRFYLNIPLIYYDVMTQHPGSLKAIEATVGKNISESEVDFNLDRPLTESEKDLTESYNRDDLNQTFDDLKYVKSEFQLCLDLIKEFNLPMDAMHWTEAQIAEKVLNVSPLTDISHVKPILYPQMRIKNEVALDYYINEKFRTSYKPKITLCGVEHQMGAGGMHGDRKCCHYDWAYYFDVSGYYNLVMINYNLLSRAIPEEGKKLYEYMYHEQIRLKKIDPVKRAVYKKILLAVFGAQMNEHCKLYDPYNGALVPIVGQMFLIDLLEKLEGKVELIQSNTDGVIAKPLESTTEEEVIEIIKEWENRTGFTLKLDKIYDIYQRDVNCYMYRDDKGNIHTKGEAVKYYNDYDNPLSQNSYNSREPLIIGQCIVEYFLNNQKPEVTVVKYANDLRLYQYICKCKSYDYLEFQGKKLQKVNRCFASKKPGMIYKVKPGKHDKYQNLPDAVFVWNDDIKLVNKKDIDFIYYAKRAYERINEFIPNTKEVKVKETIITKENEVPIGGQLSLF